MPCEEKERAETDLELPFSFSVAVLTHLFAGFVSTAVASGMRPLFGAHPKMVAATLAVLTMP